MRYLSIYKAPERGFPAVPRYAEELANPRTRRDRPPSSRNCLVATLWAIVEYPTIIRY